MKAFLPFCAFVLLSTLSLTAQVTQINSNNSLTPIAPLPNGKMLLASEIDSTLWVTDGTLISTLQLSNSIKYNYAGNLLGSTYIFSGNTPTTGIEVFKTDGTVGGTSLVSDINPTSASSIPDVDFATLNGFVYFTAFRPAEGRELWRTNGTPSGTTLVKDIVSGPTGSNTTDAYHLFSNNSYLLLSVRTATEGAELWKSDGTDAGTIPLANINPGAASSNPDYFSPYNNLVIFQATDAAHGTEYWKTNGTPAGTTILKDINPGPGNMFSFTPLPFQYRFNNKLFFVANDGTTGDEVWSTDGTEINTVLLKDIQSSATSFTSVINAVKVGDKFFFTSSDLNTRFEMWQSDGTPTGTTLFKAFTPADFGGSPFIFPPNNIDFENLTVTQPLFQGNKFFFTAGTVAEGVELWVSDGTLPGTKMVKNIGPNASDGVSFSSYAYTSANFYFSANDNVKGLEVYKSDGTEAGTSMVADINPNAADADPVLYYFVTNGRLFFNATNGDNPTAFDLYVLEGVLPLPIHLLDFTVAKNTGSALVQWSTSREMNTRDFLIQRSDDGQNFTTLGTIPAIGNSINKSTYQFIDAGISAILKPKVFYRLQQREKDGSSSYSRVISLTLSGQNSFTIKVLGNPATNVLPLQLSSSNQKITIRIVDASGKLVRNQQTINGNGIVTLLLHELRSGVYTLIAESMDERKIIKFVKQ